MNWYDNKDVLANFLANVKLPEAGTDDCWIWLGSTSRTQAIFTLPTKLGPQSARRLMYEFLGGTIPAGRRLKNQTSCKPWCVRPDHMVVNELPLNRVQQVVKEPEKSWIQKAEEYADGVTSIR